MAIDPSGLYIGAVSSYSKKKSLNILNDLNNHESENIKERTEKMSESHKNNLFLRNSDNKSININNDIKNNKVENNFFLSSPTEKAGKKNTIISFWEIGTGKFINELTNIFEVSKIKFSNEGKYISICGEQGNISVWKLPNLMTLFINKILDELKRNSKFLNTFRINYKNDFES